MDIGRSFTFQFEDKRWLNKLGLAAIIAAVPILNFALSGYIVDIIRNVAREAAEPLPEWDDLGKKFTEGIILIAAGLVYALPALILFCLPVTLMVLSGALSTNQNLQDMANSVATAGGVLFYCLLCVLLIYVLLLSIISPAVAVVYVREGTFAACFKFGVILRLIREHASSFFLGWVGYVAATIIVSLVVGFLSAILGWIPCIGQAVTLILGLGSLVYLSTVYGHLFGQFAREANG